LGTGCSQPFNDVAVAVINQCRHHNGEAALDLTALQQQGLIEYIDFPEALKGKYQSFTQADISALRSIGYTKEMLTVAEGTARYVDILREQNNA
jgi:ADP-L-glycero-D-manno-heptose 6-epimerase